MKILGIDPGTATTGFGVIEVDGHDTYRVLGLGIIETARDTPHGQRLEQIYDGITQVIQDHSPEVVAIERLFFATNALTAIAVGQAIGVIKLAIHRSGLPVYDYTPLQVKLHVGGSGKADKKIIKAKIKKILKVSAKKGQKTHFDNTADALAIAVCHARKSIIVK